jgi:hypothetical protein
LSRPLSRDCGPVRAGDGSAPRAGSLCRHGGRRPGGRPRRSRCVLDLRLAAANRVVLRLGNHDHGSRWRDRVLRLRRGRDQRHGGDRAIVGEPGPRADPAREPGIRGNVHRLCRRDGKVQGPGRRWSCIRSDLPHDTEPGSIRVQRDSPSSPGSRTECDRRLSPARANFMRPMNGRWRAHGRGAARREVTRSENHLPMPRNPGVCRIRRRWTRACMLAVSSSPRHAGANSVSEG